MSIVDLLILLGKVSIILYCLSIASLYISRRVNGRSLDIFAISDNTLNNQHLTGVERVLWLTAFFTRWAAGVCIGAIITLLLIDLLGK